MSESRRATPASRDRPDRAMDLDRWLALCARMGCASAAGHFDELEEAHTQRHRRYHTARHIEECLSLFDSLRDLCEFPDEVEFAIWLHDAVYRPRRGDNEEKSAELAVRWLHECGTDPDSVERIRRLVLATSHTDAPRTRDEQILADIDLHILGATAERFAEYEAQVRAEYRWVPSPLFRRERARILRHFLDRDPLYRTEACRARFETSARRNLRRSLERLT